MMTWLPAILVILTVPVGLALSLLTLPGVWLMLAAAVGAQLWHGELMSWWTLGACTALALLGEIIELLASSAGAKAAGGSKSGSLGALIGSIAGAILGTFFIPPIGTIIGAIAGAGLGAMIGEKAVAKRSWSRSSGVAAGAAAGRLVSTIAKLIIAGAVGLVLVIAALW